MRRRIPGREPVSSGTARLGVVSAPLVSALVAVLPDPELPDPDRAEADDPEPDPLDDQWRAYLASRSRVGRDRLVERYAPLVRTIAHRIAAGLPAHVEHADLVQSGVFGLIDAIERFDPARSPRFEAFGARRIRGAILDELRAQDWVPRTVRDKVRLLERAQERLEARLLRAATDRELSAETGLTLRDVRDLARRVQLVSVEELDEADGMGGLLPADTPDPGSVVQSRELMRQLNTAVAGLGERDRTVVHLYYVENRTLAEIGRLLGVTESRVCQLHTRLVGRLRGRLEELAGA